MRVYTRELAAVRAIQHQHRVQLVQPFLYFNMGLFKSHGNCHCYVFITRSNSCVIYIGGPVHRVFVAMPPEALTVDLCRHCYCSHEITRRRTGWSPMEVLCSVILCCTVLRYATVLCDSLSSRIYELRDRFHAVILHPPLLQCSIRPTHSIMSTTLLSYETVTQSDG